MPADTGPPGQPSSASHPSAAGLPLPPSAIRRVADAGVVGITAPDVRGEPSTSEREELRLRDRAPGQQAVPESITFLDALPRSSVGKLLRDDLREHHWLRR